MAQEEDNWLRAWVLKAVGNKKEKKHKAFSDEDDDGPAPCGLFKEINNLRTPEAEMDADAIERAKYTDSFFGQVASSKVFEFSTLGMISLNALAIGVDADYSATVGKPDNLNDGPMAFIVVEWIFALYFTTEVLIRFFAYKNKCDIFCDSWFMFDSTLVTMMVLETWVLPFIGGSGPPVDLSILRLLRLLRITRMARLMRAVPEMMVIVKGMVAAARTVICTGILLVLILYIFCILFTDAYHEPKEPPEEETDAQAMFGTMGKSAFSLFIMGTVLDDVTQMTNAIRETENYWMLSCAVVFILISSFMMLNMLIGVLVEVVGATAAGEKEKSVELNVREAIGEIFHRMDKDSNRAISRQEFLAMRKDKNVMDALSELDITGPHFNLYAELFFRQEENGVTPSLTYDKLVSMILRLRPGSFVSALDFAAFAKLITGIHDRVKERIVGLERLCEDVSGCDRPPITNGAEFGPPAVGSVLPPPLVGDPQAFLSLCEPGTPTSPTNQVSAFNGGPVSPQLCPTVPALPPPSLPQELSNENKERLERTSSMDIVEELQRRLGIADLEKTGVPYSMMDEEMQNRLRAATERQEQEMQAFMTLGVPDNDAETVYV